jgi:lipoprotein signal peptidase
LKIIFFLIGNNNVKAKAQVEYPTLPTVVKRERPWNYIYTVTDTCVCVCVCVCVCTFVKRERERERESERGERRDSCSTTA